MKRLSDWEKGLAEIMREAGLPVPLLHCCDSVSSTMDEAFALPSDAPHGTLVFTRCQTSGRGRFGRVWHSPEGGLYFSILLTRYDFKAPHAMMAAQAVYRCFRKNAGDVSLKWINDVLWKNGKKVAGVLTEERAGRTVVGIGVNLNVRSIPPVIGRSTSFLIETGKQLDSDVFACCVLREFYTISGGYEADPHGTLRAWESDAGLSGRRVRVENENGIFRGTTLGINEQTGALIIQTGKAGDRRNTIELYEGSLFYE